MLLTAMWCTVAVLSLPSETHNVFGLGNVTVILGLWASFISVSIYPLSRYHWRALCSLLLACLTPAFIYFERLNHQNPAMHATLSKVLFGSPWGLQMRHQGTHCGCENPWWSSGEILYFPREDKMATMRVHTLGSGFTWSVWGGRISSHEYFSTLTLLSTVAGSSVLCF